MRWSSTPFQLSVGRSQGVALTANEFQLFHRCRKIWYCRIRGGPRNLEENILDRESIEWIVLSQRDPGGVHLPYSAIVVASFRQVRSSDHLNRSYLAHFCASERERSSSSSIATVLLSRSDIISAAVVALTSLTSPTPWLFMGSSWWLGLGAAMSEILLISSPSILRVSPIMLKSGEAIIEASCMNWWEGR